MLAPKRVKFAGDIRVLTEQIRGQKTACDLIKKLAEDKKRTHETFKKEITLLEDFIAENRVKIKECATTTLSLEKAFARLRELCTKGTRKL